MVPGALRFGTWERSIADNLGLGAAVEYALSFGLPAIEERVTGLAARLREDLSQTLGVTVRDKGVRKSGIVTFTVDGMRARRGPRPGGRRGRQRQRHPHLVGPARLRRPRPDGGRPRVPHYYTSDDELDRLLAALR